MSNALDPNLMTAAERIREIGELLALGILRLHANREQTAPARDLSLDFPGNQSVHARKRKTKR